uniref:WW domain containing adaptor with coiled-coil n=1 Tax=Petromyzon marinus TaxID=7757 RepID=S4R7D1_PETMA
MVMYTRKQPRLNDGYHERRQTHPQQSVNKYPAKTEGDADSRNDKMRDSRDASPASKIPRKSSSPDVREQKTNSLQSKPRDKCRVSGDAVDGSSQNNSARPISNSHGSEQHKNPATQPHDLADDWSEHISSSGKKYYYNCRTEVSQWEKPKEWVEREQRQKEAANRIVANSFPKDRDYRREAMQTAVTVKDKHSSEVGSVLAQTVLSQTSKHNDRDYRLPRTEAPGSGTSSSTPLQQQASLGVKPGSSLPNCSPSPVPSSPFNLPEQQQQQHQQHHKKQNDSNGANTLTKPHPAGSSTGQRPEKKAILCSLKTNICTPTTSPDMGHSASATPSPSPSSTSRLTPVTPTSATMPSLPSQDPAVLRQILHTSPQINPSLERLQEGIQIVLARSPFTALKEQLTGQALTALPNILAAPTLLPQAVQAAHQAHQQSQSPASQTSDVSSPRSHISPRVATPQTSGSQTRAHATTPHSHNSAQSKASAMSVKCGVHQSQGSQQAGGTERHTYTSPGSPATSGGHRHHPSGGHPSPARTMSGSHAGSAQPSVSSLSNACQALSGLSSLSPGLSSHYCENLTKHVQGWPAEHLEKQAARLREESYSLGCLQMSEICTELKNARSLVRVSEIQATLREQRILFLRQQNKELEKLKNQNSFMM